MTFRAETVPINADKGAPSAQRSIDTPLTSLQPAQLFPALPRRMSSADAGALTASAVVLEGCLEYLGTVDVSALLFQSISTIVHYRKSNV